MYIREATSKDNESLQNLQAQCPMGASLIVSQVNTPDFFARAKAYENHNVYVACDDNQIIGSAASAIREAIINGGLKRIGYEFQYFTSPDSRRKGAAMMLHRNIEDYFKKEEVALSFLVIMEGNEPSIRLFDSQGFKLHRTLVMPTVFSYKAIERPSVGQIRPINPKDMATVAELLNETWKGYDFYEPYSAESLARLIDRTPAFTFNDFIALEDHGEILACLGAWDWSQITKLTVKALSLRLKMIALIIDLASLFRAMPRSVKPGTTLKQWCLTLIGFKAPEHLATLLRYMNNLAMKRGIDQIFCVCEQDHEILSALKGLFHVNVGVHLYVKSFEGELDPKNRVFLNGIDL
jgi:GNAT superfamily N-acetyltransferase